MNLGRNGEAGPGLTISNAAESSFSTFAMGTCWVISPKLRIKAIPYCITATIPKSSAAHDDSA
eukprot:3806328-Prorocentrum_lima.AAC.1